MKHVEYYDSKNKQEFLHGGQNLASLSNQCQAFIILRWVELSLRNLCVLCVSAVNFQHG